jgi:membrane-associated phospholipid phosphatase
MPNETLEQIAARLRETLSLADICTICMLVFYTVLNVLYFAHVEHAAMNIVANISLSAALIGLALADSYAPSQPITIMRKFFLTPGLFFVYGQAHIYIHLVNPVDVDTKLIAIDYALFGVHPTQWLYQFTHPVLTELLQIAYCCYFFIPLVIGIELYVRKDFEQFMMYAFVLSFSFYLSYLLYFFTPAVGPCFTLHSFSTLKIEMPGLWATDFLRDIVNGGSGIPPTSKNPVLTAHRNCMPSGHTMITVVNLVVAYRVKSRFRGVILMLGICIIISTVYLRYHYVIDVIAGIAAAICSLVIALRMRAWFQCKGFVQA